MSQKKKSQLLKEKEQLEMSKAELESTRENSPKDWTPSMQVKLDEVIGELADVYEELEVITVEDEKNSSYTPKKGTEKLVHLSIVKGRRFNPNTGKEETKPFVQLFTFSEWQLFKKNFAGLGYTIVGVLHDPFGDAKSFVTTN